MTDTAFYIFGGIAILASLLVIAQRNPVYSVLLLIASFGALSGLYVLLEAPFVAVIQIIVYAGAIMVLFLFVVMLLDLKAEERRRIRAFGLIAGLVSVAALIAIFFRSLAQTPLPAAAPADPAGGSTARLGHLLFTQYLLPFEIVSVLLLVAMVGVILLSKRDLK